jgi:hypothetical protein
MRGRLEILSFFFALGGSAAGCANTTTVSRSSHAGQPDAPWRFSANAPEIDDCEPNLEVELSPADVASLRHALREVTGNPIHTISRPGNADKVPDGSLMIVTRDEGDCGTGSGSVYWARRQGGAWFVQRAKNQFIGWNAVSERSVSPSSAEPHNRALNLTALRVAG